MKAWILGLLLANLVLAGAIITAETRSPVAAPSTDLNTDKLRLVALPPEPVAPPGK